MMVLDDIKAGHGGRVDIDAVQLDEIAGERSVKKLGTEYDQRDMTRMGKRQELRVGTLHSEHHRHARTDAVRRGTLDSSPSSAMLSS